MQTNKAEILIFYSTAETRPRRKLPGAGTRIGLRFDFLFRFHAGIHCRRFL